MWDFDRNMKINQKELNQTGLKQPSATVFVCDGQAASLNTGDSQ